MFMFMLGKLHNSIIIILLFLQLNLHVNVVQVQVQVHAFQINSVTVQTPSGRNTSTRTFKSCSSSSSSMSRSSLFLNQLTDTDPWSNNKSSLSSSSSSSSSFSSSSFKNEKNNKTKNNKNSNRNRRKKRQKAAEASTKKIKDPTSIQTWRIFGVEVHPDDLGQQFSLQGTPNKRTRKRKRKCTGSTQSQGLDDTTINRQTLIRNSREEAQQIYLCQPLIQALQEKFNIQSDAIHNHMNEENNSKNNNLDESTTSQIHIPKQFLDIRVVRRSLDARKRTRFANSNTNTNTNFDTNTNYDTSIIMSSRGDHDNDNDDIKTLNHSSNNSPSPRYTYVVDIDVTKETAIRDFKLRKIAGKQEQLDMNMHLDLDQNVRSTTTATSTATSTSTSTATATSTATSTENKNNSKHISLDTNDTVAATNSNKTNKPKIIIIGAGPSGLFCALSLAKTQSCTPILLERGQPVESRGKDIGALINRKKMNTESNFAFGEGGAGTWSDGKLTTRIGRNSGAVRQVLETFVTYGAPSKILVDGSPHLGTDNLVRLLRNMRDDIRKLGGQIYFGTKMTNINIDPTTQEVQSVNVQYKKSLERNTSKQNYDIGNEDIENSIFKSEKGNNDDIFTIHGDAFVLATGHSARDVYEGLYKAGIKLEPKGFAAGFRVEHPQKIINQIQYGNEWGRHVHSGKSTTDSENLAHFLESDKNNHDHEDHNSHNDHEGILPVPSYRLATDKAFDGEMNRGAYSFCMCPGGQVVPASTDPNEVCVNGMSFSRRDSKWANSALVVTINPDDPILIPYREKYGVLAGIQFQRDMEICAAKMGGGNFTVPVQRLVDFVRNVPSTSAPSSSYRLGTKPSPCHEIYPKEMTVALQDALLNHFENKMPGFICEDGLLHGVETRTSSPVRVCRDRESMKAIGLDNLYPAGEGAGFAGGIVSAAVDGIVVADAILDQYNLVEISKESDNDNRSESKIKSVGFTY